ncbi:MAG: hypothetical protein AB7D06_17215 [Pedobacter sp.]
MAINGNTASFGRSEEKAGLPGHSPVLVGIILAGASGVYPVGLLLTRDGADVGQPLQVVVAEVLGAGDGATKDFAATLGDGLPVEPGTITVTDGVEAFADDGSGRLVGDAGGTGTINYATAAIAVSFAANVVNEVDVTADYITRVDAVLDQEIDTAAETSGNAVIHGTVATQALKVGALAKAAPSAALLKKLRRAGIYPI